MTHHDRHLNIKVRDVIQIYRIFDNLRDSKDDNFDEIKLFKLQTFPFVDQEDYDKISAEVKKIYDKKSQNSKKGNRENFVECRVEGPLHSIGDKSPSGNCLYCTGVDQELQYKVLYEDNEFTPLRAGRNYSSKNEGTPERTYQENKSPEIFDLENKKVEGQPDPKINSN